MKVQHALPMGVDSVPIIPDFNIETMPITQYFLIPLIGLLFLIEINLILKVLIRINKDRFYTIPIKPAYCFLNYAYYFIYIFTIRFFYLFNFFACIFQPRIIIIKHFYIHHNYIC